MSETKIEVDETTLTLRDRDVAGRKLLQLEVDGPGLLTPAAARKLGLELVDRARRTEQGEQLGRMLTPRAPSDGGDVAGKRRR